MMAEEPARWRVVDGEGGADAVFARLLGALRERGFLGADA